MLSALAVQHAISLDQRCSPQFDQTAISEVTLLPNNPNMKLFHGPRHKPPVTKQQQSVCNGIAPSITPSTPFIASISNINSLNSIWIQIVNPSGPCPW